MLMAFVQGIANGFTNLHPLSCNSINQIPESVAVAFIYISPTSRDCTFLFEGPAHLSLNMNLRNLVKNSQLTWDDKCSNSTLRMYNYLKDNRVELDKIVCSEAAVITAGNMGIVTSSKDGAFVVEVRALAKRTVPNFEIFGMIPPVDGARDFYGSNGFTPSPGLPSSWSPYRALPVTSFYPTYFSTDGPYPGKPTTFVDLTYNQTEPTHAAINSTTNMTTLVINGVTTNSSQQVFNMSTEEPTTTEHTSTYVEINISNSTEIKH